MNRQFAASAVLFCLSLLPSVTLAGDGKSPIEAASPLMAAMTAGGLCDKEIDVDASGRYLTGALGADARFTPQQIAGLLFMQVAQQSMQASMGALPRDQKSRKSYCSQMMGAFGPSGTQIPGILKP